MIDVGEGRPDAPAIVLLHGWTATAALNWVYCFEPLAEHFRVVALDQRGHGRGIRPESRRGFRLEDCADDVVALADVLELGSIIPVGYSMGGPVAQLTWQRHRDRVNGLVLCATSRNFRGTERPMIARAAISGGLTGVAAALRTLPQPVRRAARAGIVRRRRMLGMPAWAIEEVSRNDPASLLDAGRCLAAFSSADWIGEVDVPTGVVITTRDRIVPPGRQYKLAHAIPGASIWPVEGDHDVCVAAPSIFATAVVDACQWASGRAVSAPLPAARGDLSGRGGAPASVRGARPPAPSASEH